MDTTVVYYTANREHPEFESKIQQRLLHSIGRLPLISVSQRPIENFGQNICVGDLPWCDVSAFHQLLIGLKAAQTKYAIVAESDCLYPPEYFTFTPEHDDRVYRYTNVFILYSYYGPRNLGRFWRKQFSEGAQMCGREYWIERLEAVLREHPIGTTEKPQLVFTSKNDYAWTHAHPVISFKTSHGLRKHRGVGGRSGTNGFADSRNSTKSVPYWGQATDLRFAMCGPQE